MKPLYMWAGGKSRMINKYLSKPGIPYDGFDTYVEPFFGGGAMMIHIHKNCPNVKRFVINDINPYLIDVYNTIKNDVGRFTKRMDELQNKYLSMEGPAKEKKIDCERKVFYKSLLEEYITDWKKWDPTTENATLYFLMKTGFNGIWQTTKKSGDRFATPAGLLNQKDRVYDYNNVMKWHSFLQKVDIHCGDWLDCMNKIDPSEKSFLFADPPYRDSFTSYEQEFNDEEHSKLISFCEEFSKNNIVFLCNRDEGDGFFSRQVDNLNISKYDVNYTAGRRQDKKKKLLRLEGKKNALEKRKVMAEKKSKTLEDRATVIEEKQAEISRLKDERTSLQERKRELQLSLKEIEIGIKSLNLRIKEIGVNAKHVRADKKESDLNKKEIDFNIKEVNAEIKETTNNQNFEAKKATEVLMHNFSERKEQNV